MSDAIVPRLSELEEQLDAALGRTPIPVHSDDVSGNSVLVLDSSPPAPGITLDAPVDRRVFLARASALTLAIPGLGAALTACGNGDSDRRDSGRAAVGQRSSGFKFIDFATTS